MCVHVSTRRGRTPRARAHTAPTLCLLCVDISSVNALSLGALENVLGESAAEVCVKLGSGGRVDMAEVCVCVGGAGSS